DFYSSSSRVRPLQTLLYVVTYVGSPFWTTKWGVAGLLGSLGIGGVIASAYYIRKYMPGWMESSAPWLLLACYTGINGIVTALGRIDFGVEQANQARYRSIVIPLWISLIVTLSMIAFHLSPRLDRRVLSAGLASAIILFLGGYSYLYYRGFRYIRLQGRLCAD